MNNLRLPVTLLLVAACSLAVTPASKKKATARKSTAKTSAKGKKKAPATSWRSTQRVPTPDRYKEIQQALSGKGYAANPTGVWDASSIEALKKFQADQNLEPSGKIDSLSLIALGLGPKREQAQAAVPPPPQP